MSGPSEETAGKGDRTDEWFRKLVEEANDITLVVDSDGTMSYVSPATKRQFGYRPAELTGDQLCDYVHPEDGDALAGTVERIQTRDSDAETAEVRFQRADGTWFWLEATMRSRLDDTVDGIIVNGRDITERREREAELRTAKERMKMALEGANLGIWDWDMEADEVTRDELLTEMLGYTPAEMGDRLEDWERLVHPEGKRRHDEALAEHVENRTPYYECEYRLKTKSGDWKWVRTMGTVVERDENGEPLRSVGIHQDIAELKEYEQKLEEQRDNLNTLNQVLRHDIRNDIQLIISYAELLESESDDEGIETYIETILENADHAAELTKSAGEMADVMLATEEELRAIPLLSTLEREIEEVTSGYPTAELTVEAAIPAVSVRANDILGSVFRNLLKNAVQHNDKVVPKVAVSAKVHGESVVVRIADNGPGIPDSHKGDIFGKGETNLDSHGTGIGLYLVKTLVERYGGGVWIEDSADHIEEQPPFDEGVGAVFAVELPKAESP